MLNIPLTVLHHLLVKLDEDLTMTAGNENCLQLNRWSGESILMSKRVLKFEGVRLFFVCVGFETKSIHHGGGFMYSSSVLARHHLNGQSHLRVQRILGSRCRCSSGKCFKIFKQSDLMAFLVLFWSLAKTLQDAYVSCLGLLWIGGRVNFNEHWSPSLNIGLQHIY